MQYTLAAFSLLAASGVLAQSSTTSTTPTTISDGPTNIPSPGGPCVGYAYCLADTSPIILRCENGIAQPGNCDDNLNEPQYGAICVSNAPEQAYCTAVNPFANSTTTTSTSTTIISGTAISTTITSTTQGGNGTLSHTPTAPPVTSTTGSGSGTGSGSAPVSTGGAAGHWAGGAMFGAAVAVLGGVAIL